MDINISEFNKIEKKYDLNHIRIDTVYPWTYFRLGFWNYRLCENLLELSESAPASKGVKPYLEQLKTLLNLFVLRRNNPSIHPADLLFISHPRRVKSGDYYECIYTDELAKKYKNSIVMEKQYQGRHFTPVQTEEIYYTDMVEIRAELSSRLHGLFRTGRYQKIYEEVKSRFTQPLQEIEQAYGYQIHYEQVFRQLTGSVLRLSVMRRALKKRLWKIHPKLVIEVVYYGALCMLVNELAKEMGIPTIELQHGTMHAAHAAYQFPEGCGEIAYFPQYEFTFSEYWKTCAHLPIPEEHVKVTGYPYFERQLDRYRDVKKEEKTTVIFVSQGTIGIELSRLAADLSELLDPEQYHIIYKLHPAEYEGWKSRMPWLKKDTIEVVDSREHNIYEYFAKCHIQVGVYSTAIYEGLGFGLTTYIYHIGHADTLADLCAQGYASYVSGAEELCRAIVAGQEEEGHDGKEFWKLNSFDNMCNEIDEMLK